MCFPLGQSYLYLCAWCETVGWIEIGPRTFCLLAHSYVPVNYQQKSVFRLFHLFKEVESIKLN